MKRKWLATGIILLFVGTSVLSDISARVVDVGTNTNNSLETYTFTFVGFITDKNVTIHPSGDKYNLSFTCLLVFRIINHNGSRDFKIFHYPDKLWMFAYNNYNGIFTEHIVCAKFYW